MADNIYWLKFGSGHPTLTSGLSPTFLFFAGATGVTITPPGITQPIAGWGFYQFEYGPSFSIAFSVDGATTGTNLSASDRYIVGNIDITDNPVNVDLTSVTGALGTTTSSFGDSSTDPIDVLGYLKRVIELLEGNAQYVKNTGVWTMTNRTGSTTLRTKTLSDSSSQTNKV